MENKIKEKYELIDLARYGTNARKEIRPKLYVGKEGKYPEGDILDANLQTILFNELTLQNVNCKVFMTKDDFNRAMARGEIYETTLCFIFDESEIYYNGETMEGGGGGSKPIDISSTPIYRYVFADRNTPVPTNLNVYTPITLLSASRTWSYTLANNFISLAIPGNINLTSVRTQWGELILSNMEIDTTSVPNHRVYTYRPAVAPSSLTLTFTFTVS